MESPLFILFNFGIPAVTKLIVALCQKEVNSPFLLFFGWAAIDAIRAAQADFGKSRAAGPLCDTSDVL